MKTEELIERLSAFNEWRRGAEMPQPSPEDIGKWIEWACCVLDEQAKALQSFEVALTSIANLSKTLREERDEAREVLKHIAEYGTEEINAAVEHPLDNGIPERHEVYIWKNGKYELDP